MTPFALRLDASGETGLLSDGRCGFTQLLPGRPALVAPAGDGPRHEARVLLSDAPIDVRYRLDRLPDARQPASLARVLAQAYMAERAAEACAPALAGGARILAWGVDAAASAIYPLRRAGAAGDTEAITVLVRREGLAMVVTQVFPSSEVPPALWARFSSAAQVSWREGPPPGEVPRAWPESALLGPGLRGDLSPGARARVPALRAVLARADLGALRPRLHGLLGGGEPPATELDDAARAALAGYLLDAAPGAAGHALRSLLAAVRTSHDLRGAALLLLEATRP
jgi:hypothetical protein